MDPDERARASITIARRFLSSAHFLRSDTIGCYLAMHDEVDTAAILDRAWRAKKRIFVPVITSRTAFDFVEIRRSTRLAMNAHGIWEPMDGRMIRARELDTCIVPTVAFDAFGNRIGMGGGYYDRTFSFARHCRQWRRTKLIGVAFECQRIDSIDARRWDIPLHSVITERV